MARLPHGRARIKNNKDGIEMDGLTAGFFAFLAHDWFFVLAALVVAGTWAVIEGWRKRRVRIGGTSDPTED